jgi:hypothetical protein
MVCLTRNGTVKPGDSVLYLLTLQKGTVKKILESEKCMIEVNGEEKEVSGKDLEKVE